MRINDLGTPTASTVLMSMDVFLSGYRKAQKLADDKLALERLANTYQWKHRFNFAEQLFLKGSSVLVTNTSSQIVFASSGISALTGYEPAEVVGKTPRLFQGEKTAAAVRSNIRHSIEKKMAFDESMLNYRKNGSIYNCHIKGFPIFNRSKILVHFIAFENELEIAS